jgi:hypothetical protein
LRALLFVCRLDSFARASFVKDAIDPVVRLELQLGDLLDGFGKDFSGRHDGVLLISGRSFKVIVSNVGFASLGAF